MINIVNAIINEMIAITIDIISNAVIGTTSLLLQVREAIHLVHDYSIVSVYHIQVYFSILFSRNIIHRITLYEYSSPLSAVTAQVIPKTYPFDVLFHMKPL